MKNTLFLLLFDIKNDIIKNISKGGIMESYNFAERKEENNKYYSAGMKEYHNKNWLKAIEYLEKSLKLEEKYYRTYFTLGKCYLNIHKKGKGEELFKEVIELDSKNVYARLELGKLYAKQGKEEESEKLFKECIELDRKNVYARLELGKLYAKQGKEEESEKLFKEYIELDRKGLHPRLELGKLYAKQGRKKESEELFKEVIELDQKNVYARLELGKLYAKQGKEKEAEELFKEVIELDQKNVYARLELGKLYAKQGKEKEKEEEKLLDKEIPRSTEKENRGKKLESSNIEENNKYIIQKGIKQESKGNTKTSSTSRVKENKEKQAKKIGEIIRENTKSAVNKIGITYYAKMRLCSDKAEDIHKETERVRKYIKKYDKLQSILECSEGNKRAKMELMLVLINEGYSKIVENEYPDEYKFINSLVEEYKKREKTADVVKKEIDEYSL